MAARAREAERLGVAFLGEVPLEMGIRRLLTGTPVVVSRPDSAEAEDLSRHRRKGLGAARRRARGGRSRAGDRVRIGVYAPLTGR